MWITAVGCLIVYAIKISHVETLYGLQACWSKVVDVGVCSGQGQHSLCAARAKASNEVSWNWGLFVARDERLSLSVQLGGVLGRVCMRKVA